MKKPYKLPDSLEASGKRYPIETGYREWMEFEQILDRSDLTEEEKQVFALRKVLKGPAPHEPLAFLELFLQAAWFCRCGLPVVPGDDGRKTLDFYKDFWAVWADFLTYNGVDLLKMICTGGNLWRCFKVCQRMHRSKDGLTSARLPTGSYLKSKQ